MPRAKVNTTGIFLKISRILLDRMDAVAKEKGMSRSEFTRHLIQNAIEKEEDKQQK